METARAAGLARPSAGASRIGYGVSSGVRAGRPGQPGRRLRLRDHAFDLTERERDSGRIEELRAQLAGVERAERRLADGTYGTSVESGEPISDRRLELLAAELTADEQRRRGRRGA